MTNRALSAVPVLHSLFAHPVLDTEVVLATVSLMPERHGSGGV